MSVKARTWNLTKVLVFDKWSKVELFKKYYGPTKTIKILYSYHPIEALEIVRNEDPDVILLGGDIYNDYKAAQFARLLVTNEYLKGRIVFSTTWDHEEAKVIRTMLPDVFYCPFSESLVNMVKLKTQQRRLNKGRNKSNKAQTN